MPGCQTDLPVAVAAGNFGDAVHLRGKHAPDRHNNTNIIKAFLRLIVDTDVAMLQSGATGLAFFQWQVGQVESQFFICLREEFFDTPVIDQVLQAGLLAVGAVAVFDKDTDHRCSNRDGLGWLQEQTSILGKLLVTGDAAKLHTKIDSRLDTLPFGDANGVESDVVGICANGDASAVVKGDVELAGQSVEVAVVQDVVMHRLGIGQDIEDFLGIESAGRTGRNIAQVVSPGAA